MTRDDLPAAILWDMDGTLIDSEPYWIDAECELAAQFGAAWTRDDGLKLVGSPLPTSALILRDAGIDLSPQEIIDALIASVAARAREAMPWIDESRALLDLAREVGIPCALVTMSVGEFVEVFLDQAGAFDAVVTGDQVSRGKPDPEAYLLASARLGVNARDCVAIEDSIVGVAAAQASGAVTVAVARHVELPRLEGVTYLESLAGVELTTLRDLVGRARNPR